MIIERAQLIRKMLLDHLLENGYEFVDRSGEGGGFYFFDEALAEELKAKGYRVKFAQEGARSTGNRPAWYIALRDY